MFLECLSFLCGGSRFIKLFVAYKVCDRELIILKTIRFIKLFVAYKVCDRELIILKTIHLVS